jgi:hypothetical protein
VFVDFSFVLETNCLVLSWVAPPQAKNRPHEYVSYPQGYVMRQLTVYGRSTAKALRPKALSPALHTAPRRGGKRLAKDLALANNGCQAAAAKYGSQAPKGLPYYGPQDLSY